MTMGLWCFAITGSEEFVIHRGFVSLLAKSLGFSYKQCYTNTSPNINAITSPKAEEASKEECGQKKGVEGSTDSSPLSSEKDCVSKVSEAPPLGTEDTCVKCHVQLEQNCDEKGDGIERDPGVTQQLLLTIAVITDTLATYTGVL